MMKSLSQTIKSHHNNSNISKNDPLSSSPNTITLCRGSTTIPPSAPPPPSCCGDDDNVVMKPHHQQPHHHQRHFTVTDGISQHLLMQRKSQQSPSLDPTILSVLGEDERSNLITPYDTVVVPPLSSSPGTPPKKLWERQYKSFLRHRDTTASSTSSNNKAKVGTTTTTTTTSSGSPELPLPSLRRSTSATSSMAPNSPRTSSGGTFGRSGSSGNFLSNVLFRSSDRTKTPVDELDGTMRRGRDKSHSPRMNRPLHHHLIAPTAQQQVNSNHHHTASVDRGTSSSSFAPPPPPLQATTMSTTSKFSSSPPHTALRPRITVVEDFSTLQHVYRDREDLLVHQQNSSAQLPMEPPILLPPGALVPLHPQVQQSSVSKFEQLQNELFPNPVDRSKSDNDNIINSFERPNAERSNDVNRRNHDPTPTTTTQQSTALKKAFTDFHNTSIDANSAYLGDDPSMSGRALAFSMKNQQLVKQLQVDPSRMTATTTTTIKTSKSHGEMMKFHDSEVESMEQQQHRTRQMLEKESIDIRTSARILKPIVGVDAWQAGRRYLMAPAILASCPGSAISIMFGKSFEQLPHSLEHMTPSFSSSAASLTESSSSPFGMIVLGECLLSYMSPPVPTTSASSATTTTSRTVQEWSSAQLVLRQNYLLEYDLGADVRTGIPRGYAHLQYATTVLHDHFHDTLELHFFGSPCAKDDARILMIRIVSSPLGSLSVAASPSNGGGTADESGASWRPKIRDAWCACLNRAARLMSISDLYDYDQVNVLGQGQYAEVRAARRRQSLNPDDGKVDSADPPYDCALKIIDKNKFWRQVLKGRERADTIVRETSVQATLMAKGGQYSSFLQLRGFFETAESVVLELELLDGTDLFKYIVSKGIVQETEAAVIMRDVLSCLDVMSKNGMAHRDVKPANILMCSETHRGASEEDTTSTAPSSMTCTNPPRVKIGDFGMAAFVGVDGQVRGRCGTPGYVAPEIFTAGVYGGYGNKVDVFSAGVTLYVMLCGYEPFYGETDDELKDANKAAIYEFPNDEWDHISVEAKDLVQHMMQSDPRKRYDARQALQHPWFTKNLLSSSSITGGVSALPPTYTCRDDACAVS